MSKYEVISLPGDKEVEVDEGITLLEAAGKAGIDTKDIISIVAAGNTTMSHCSYITQEIIKEGQD